MRSHWLLLECGSQLFSPAVCFLLRAAFDALTKSWLSPWGGGWSLQECTASSEESLPLPWLPCSLASCRDVEFLFSGLHKGVLGWFRRMLPSVFTLQAAPCPPTCGTWQLLWEVPYGVRETASAFWSKSLVGHGGDIWALGKLFQRIQNCWEPNWQSK